MNLQRDEVEAILGELERTHARLCRMIGSRSVLTSKPLEIFSEEMTVPECAVSFGGINPQPGALSAVPPSPWPPDPLPERVQRLENALAVLLHDLEAAIVEADLLNGSGLATLVARAAGNAARRLTTRRPVAVTRPPGSAPA